MNAAELWQKIKPFAVRDLKVGTTGGGNTGTSVATHALDGPAHTGSLARTQAPWVATDINTALNLHTANANAHHAQSHVLATTAGLGADHTVSGLTTGQVLRATGATTAQFMGLTASDITTALGYTPVNRGGDSMTGTLSVTSSTFAPIRAERTTTLTTGVINAANILTTTSADMDDGFGTGLVFSIRDNAGTINNICGITAQRDGSDTTGALSFLAGGLAVKMTILPSGNVGIGTAAPAYKLDVSGTIRATTSLTTPIITTVGAGVDLTLSPIDDIVLTPGSNIVKLSSSKVFQSDNYASQTTGMRVTHDGQADFRYLFVDEIHAKAFMADIEQALAGGQIISKSVTILYTAFTAPAAGGVTTLTVRDLPSAPGMGVFVNGDYLRLRTFARSGGSLTIGDCWGTVTLDTTYGTAGFDSATKTQRYTFTRSAAPNAGAMLQGTVVQPDAILLDYGTSGNGYYEVNAIDGQYGVNSPYSQIVTWSGHPMNQTVRARMGNLYGIWAQSGEYGLYAGDGTANTNQYLRISNSGVKLNNIPIQLYNGTTQTVNIDSAGTNIWIGPDSNNKRLQWDGATLTVTGKIVIQANSSGYSALTDKPASLSAINSTEGTKLAGIANNATVGATWGTNLNSIPTRFGDAPGAAGLYLTPTHLGYFDGSLWKAWIASNGYFYFGGNSGAHLEWNGAKLRGLGADGTTEQWYADSTDGKIKAGSGNVELSALGIDLQQDGYLVVDRSRALSWWPTISTKTGTPSQEIIGYYDANSRSVLSLTATNATFGSRILLTADDIAVTGTLSVTGAVSATTGMSVNGVAVSLAGHTHSYLPLAGGTLTGSVTTDILRPAINNTKTVGTSSFYYSAGYFDSLYVNSIVGTPSYSHTHSASDIISGTFDFARIPTTWSGALNLDADANAGSSNYIRWTTQTGTKNWDLLARAYDYTTVTSQQNDLLLTYFDGTTNYTVFQADSATRVIDFSNTPTVGSTAVSLTGHMQAYTTLTYSGLTAGQVLRATGATTAQFMALTSGDITTALTYTPVDTSTYNSHVANANAHHAQSHVLATTAGLGADHTVSGLTTGQVLRATGATTAQFMGLTASDITTALGYTPVNRGGDSMTGTLSVTSSTFAPIRAERTTTLTTGVINAANILTTTSADMDDGFGTGLVFSIRDNAGTINNICGITAQRDGSDTTGALSFLAGGLAVKMTILPSGNVGIGTSAPAYKLDVSGTGRFSGALTGSTSFTTGFTGAGYRLDDGVATAGKTTLELDEMIVRGRMRVYELLIHQIRATNGNLFVSGVGKAKTVTGSGPYTIVTDTDHGFATNDLIRAQRFTGSSVYQCNMQVSSVASSTQFTATLSSGDAPAAGMEFVRLGNTTDTTRQGSIYLTADDTFAPAIDILDGVTSFAQWGSASKIKVRLGRLAGITDTVLNPSGYGLYSQNAYLSGDLVTGNGAVRIYNASGINLFESTWGIWDNRRALQWWADFDNMTGNPSFALYTGRVASSDFTNNQNFSYIDAFPTGGKLAGLSLAAKGQGTGTAAGLYLEGGSQVLGTTPSVTVTATTIDLVGTLLLDGTTSARQINPQSDLGHSLGTALLRWNTLYVNQIVAGTISGTTMNGQEWEYAGSMVIDANSASNTTVSVVNQGAGLASLDVENNITLGGLVDGVDVALFKSGYDSHVANANAHHAQSHVLATTAGLGADHTVSGLTTGQVLRATGATTAQFMGLTASDITTALGYTPVNRGGDSMTGTLSVTSSTFAPIRAERTTTLTTGVINAANILTTTSADMDDGFGTGLVFSIRDNAGTINNICGITAQRDGSDTTGALSFLAGSLAVKMTILASGNVGIGTAAPAYKLDVSGIAQASAGLIAPSLTTASGDLSFKAASGAIALQTASGTVRASIVPADGTFDFNPLPDVTAAANIRLFRLTNTTGAKTLQLLQGDNTTTIVHQLSVTGTSIFNLQLANLDFNIRGDTDTNLLYADASADSIGIGTSAPAYKLDVNGTGRFTGNLYGTTLTTLTGDLTLSAASGAVIVSGASIEGANWNIQALGNATLAGVYAPLVQANGSDLTVTSVSNNLILNGSSNVDVRIGGVSQWTMTSARLLPRSTLTMDIGDSNRRVRTVHAGELNVEILVAQSVMATIGGRVIVSPTNKLIADITLAATTIDVAYNNFVNGEYVYLSAAPGGAAQIEAMQVTSSATAITGGYRYSVSRNLDGSGANIWYAGDAVVSLRSAVGQGYIDLTSTNTIHNHYGPTQTFYVRTATTSWNSVSPVVTMGNLRSFVDYTGDEFGFATGNDLTLTPSTGFRGVTVDRTAGVRLFNTDIKLYESGTLRAAFEYGDGLNLLADSSATNKRQQINWWTNLTNRTGTPSSEIYTYLSTSYGPALMLTARAASGVNGVLLELGANGNSGAAGSLSILEDSSGNGKLIVNGKTSFEVRAGGYNNRIWADAGGVAINATTASYALDVNGSCHASSFPTSSDRRFKEALTPLSPVLDRLGRLGVYNFYWRRTYAGYDQFLDEQGRPQVQVGFVAQEVEQEFPELISRWRHVGRDGVETSDAYSVDYARMVPILVQAIRELRAELTALKSM